MIGGNLAFGMGGGELTNQLPAQEIWWKILWEILQGNSVGNLAGNSVGNLVGNSAGNAVGQDGGEKAYLRKAVIGGNLAFGIG